MEKGAESTGRAVLMQPKLCLTPEIPRFYTTQRLTSPGSDLFLTPLFAIAR